MKIILSNKLARQFKHDPLQKKRIKVRSALGSDIRFSVIEKLPFEVTQDLGRLAHIHYKGTYWGIGATRPIIGIITGRDPLELSGFCFRNCTRLGVWDIHGMKPMLENLFWGISHTTVPLGNINDKSDWSAHKAEVEATGLGGSYNFNVLPRGISSRKKFFGSLEYSIGPKNSQQRITLFPVWDKSLEKNLYTDISLKTLLLRGVLYIPSEEVYAHSFYSSWIPISSV